MFFDFLIKVFEENKEKRTQVRSLQKKLRDKITELELFYHDIV